MKINLHALTHTVARAAPLLGSAFAGPGGAAIGTLIAAKFGGDANVPEALHALIQADPDAALKLQEIESEHQVELKRIQLATASLLVQEHTQNTVDARQREVLVSQIPVAQRDHTPSILAYLLTVGLLAMVGGLFFCPLPSGNTPVLLGLISSVATVWVGAMAYYHGSSVDAKVKDAQLIAHLNKMSGEPSGY